jgi:8-oxo-dGTP pyrophosphatase MutT (NUDIX family)
MAEPAPTAKPAATVLLLRDSDTDEGIEVFMLRRTTAAAFAGGMYVFPGGKVDHADGEGDEGYVIAAIRECYEEAGVLLARDADGKLVTDGHPALAHRDAVHEGSIGLRELCAQHQLTPAVDDLVWISHWITPIGESSRRFDTRFFIAVAPLDQASCHDDNETIASAWIGPREALRRREQKELIMMPPTIKNLEFVAAHRNSGAAMESARKLSRPEPVLPRLRWGANGKVTGVALPGDDDYADLD